MPVTAFAAAWLAASTNKGSKTESMPAVQAAASCKKRKSGRNDECLHVLT